MKRWRIAAAAAMLAGGAACEGPAGSTAAPAEEPALDDAAPAAGSGKAPPEAIGPEPTKEGDPDQVLGAETVEVVFDGYEVGDLVWAKFSNPVQPEITALVDTRSEGLEHFLAAHQGRAMTVRLEKVRTYVEQAGGAIEARKVVGAQTAETSAEAWWGTLGEQEKAAARTATEELLYPSS